MESRIYEPLVQRRSEAFSPSPVLTELVTHGHCRIHVVRDDLLPGGSKQRAVAPYLEDLAGRGYREFVYASPFAGFAQVALAYVCRHLGLRATIFCEPDPQTAEPGRPHEFTRVAESYGARIVMAPGFREAQKAASDYAAKLTQAYLVPLGFNSAEFRRAYGHRIGACWREVLGRLPQTPRALWVPVGSGTLLTCFRDVVGDTVSINAVDVRVLASDDSRIRGARQLAHRFFTAPELFAEPAAKAAPVPANAFYDAKLWRYIEQTAQDGDVWWNVAR